MDKNYYKVINSGLNLSIYQQSGGQYCNPKTYKGLKAKIINWFIKRYLNRI